MKCVIRLVRALLNEQKLIRSFEKLGMDAPKAIDIMTHPSLAKMEASQAGEPTDVYDVRSDLVLWCNNLEKDKRYKKWSNNLMDVGFFYILCPVAWIAHVLLLDVKTCVSRSITSHSEKCL